MKTRSQQFRLLSRTLAGTLLALPLLANRGLAQDQAPPDAKPAAPFIILKLDDLTWPSPAWIRTIAFLQEKKIKSSIGIIGNSLEGNRNPYYDWIKEIQKTGLVEFWNHGWDHKQWKEDGTDVMEFKGAPYELQKEHFERSQKLAKEKLGITFHTFGAPFNATDATTLKVMSEDPDLKVFLYGKPEQAAEIPNILILDRTQMNIENPLFVPNPQRIEHDYKILAGTRDCFVIQGHPNNWDDARFEEFKKLVVYLLEQGARFTTPYEYYLFRQASPKTTSVPKLLTNGGFENGKSGWELFVSPEDAGGDCKIEVTGDNPHSGTQAGQLTSTAKARYAMVQYLKGVRFAPGQHYRVSAWVRAGEDFQAQPGTPGFALRVSMFADKTTFSGAKDGLFYVGAGGRAVRSADVAPLNGQEIPRSWTKVDAVFETSPDTAKMNVCVFVWKGSGSFYVDDVAIEDVGNTTPLSPVAGELPH